MNRRHSVQETVARTRKALGADAARAEQAGRRAVHTLAPKAVAVADGLETAADRTVDHLRSGYHRLAPHIGPTTAQRRRARRLRVVRFASVGLLGLAGVLAWRWWAGRASDEVFSLPGDGPLAPDEAVSALSDGGAAAAGAVEDSTLTSGPAGPARAVLGARVRQP
ncbi:hypothetical protein ACFC1T_18075 [Kitasatospora sp. NPDC056076]|uniref:hypothetical protein n=1 Tax=Kitasatospora sp. NPDC056076 TaxID=3345703 RepID=UPI0035E0AED4